MELSAPIHVLKKQAKELKKAKSMTMVEALNHVATQEGYASWSLLQSKLDDILPNAYSEILNYFKPGDLVIVGARPGKSFGKGGVSAVAIATGIV